LEKASKIWALGTAMLLRMGAFRKGLAQKSDRGFGPTPKKCVNDSGEIQRCS
jgi:hypothetical protein